MGRRSKCQKPKKCRDRRHDRRHDRCHEKKCLHCIKWYKSTLRGDYEIPPVTTEGYGTALYVLTRDRKFLNYTSRVFNLSSPIISGNIQVGTKYENGPIVYTFEYNANGIANGALELDDTLLKLLKCEKLYLNVFTEDNPTGELRGSILQIAPIDVICTPACGKK